MIRRRVVIALLIAMCSQMGHLVTEANPQAEVEAVEAAGAWLALVDEGRSSESWNAAAELFRKAVSKDQWGQTLAAVREPLGRVIFRNLMSKTYTTTLPGAPDGEYVVIQYESSFEHKKSAVETVTPMLDKDGRWRVSGYYIR
jgi:hypothetical protein